MIPENKEWLEAHKGHWDLYKSDQIIRNGFDFDRALQIARDEFDPRALFCTTCPGEKGLLMKYVYTQYEKLND